MTPDLEDTALAYDVGDLVWLVFWRAFAMPGRPNNGNWETTPARVVGIARNGVVCAEVTNPGVALDDAWAANSFLRYVAGDRIFTDDETAKEAARIRPAPI